MSTRLMPLTLAVLALLAVTTLAFAQADVGAQIAQAKQLKQQRRLPEAQRLLEQVLAQAPQNADAHYLLAWVLVGQGKNEPAAEHFRKAIELAPNTVMAADAAKALQRMGLSVGTPAPAPAPAPGPAPAPAPAQQAPAQAPAPPATPPAADQQGPLKTQLIDDFEANDGAWVGLNRMEQAAGTGKFGGAWLNTATVPTAMTHTLHGNDWSGFTHLQLDVCSGAANGALITLALKSDDPAVDGNDFYYTRLQMTWQGWKVLQIPLSSFTASGKPLGLKEIQNIVLASNWGPCKPLPDTILYFDNIKLVKLAPSKQLVLGSMEDDLDFWQGLKPETQLVKEGQQAGRWENLNEVPFIRCAAVPKDWRPFGALHMWVYSGAANGQELRFVAWSDSPDTKEMDGYRCDLKVDWQGWKELRLEDADFVTSYQPKGWGDISLLDIVGAGYSGMAPPKADTVLLFDDVRIEPLDPKADVAFMDFDTTGRTAFSGGATLSDAKAHSGKHSLYWRPVQDGLAFANIPHDWSDFVALSFWVYAEQKDSYVMVVAVSDRFAEEGPDGYAEAVKVPGQGWSQVRVPLQAMAPQRRPLGWDNCQRLYVFAQAKSTADFANMAPLYFDDFVLLRPQDK